MEQLDNPELVGRPVVVGAKPGGRGVVAACSYEARAFGLRSAMPISEAYRLCPGAAYLSPRMARYAELSHATMERLGDYTPKVRQISIDEASLDMRGTERLFGPAGKVARLVQSRVRTELGLSLSVGVAPNRYLAKLASEIRKPGGFCEVPKGKEIPFIDTIPLRKLWGLGKKTASRLEEAGLFSTREVRDVPLNRLQTMMGRALGSFLFSAARGEDPGMYSDTTRSHSISTETTFSEDSADRDFLESVLLDLSHQVMFRLLEEGAGARTVVVKTRTADFTTKTVQESRRDDFSSAEEVYSLARSLFSRVAGAGVEFRLIGVGLANVGKSVGQSGLFDEADRRKAAVEKAVHSLTTKFPKAAPVKARLLGRKP